ncbi:MAG: 3D domain-containing protein [Firmicutes bacterium]|nr:3D domain-containing protein [Bacillota bacterium]
MHRPSSKALALAGAVTLCSILGGASSFAAPAPSTATLETTHPAMQQVLEEGSTGHWVMTLQADLALLGYPQVGPMDGIFGPKTLAGLDAFETATGFAATGVTSPAVWQEILSGFGLVPPPPGFSAPALPASGNADGAASSTSSSTSSTSSNSASTSSTTVPTASVSGPVLPAAFPQGGTPISEPSLPGPSSGIQGQFTPTVTTIDGRPVLAAYHMVASSYGPSLADNYPYGPVDAFGQPLEDGMIAVDPSVIPLHSVVYVTGYHDNYLPTGGFLGQAMDTGGAIQGDRLDIFINANPTVISDFGYQQATVYVLGN